MKIEKLDKNNAITEEYNFEYNSIAGFTDRPLFAVDEFGYYNGQNGNTELFSGNKEVNTEQTKIGALKKITYPTKGYSEFEYESNVVKGLTASTFNCSYDFKKNKSIDVINNQSRIDSVYIPFPQTVRVIVNARARKIVGPRAGFVEASASAQLPHGSYKLVCSKTDKLNAYAYNELSPENPNGSTVDISELYESYWYVPAGYIRGNVSSSKTYYPSTAVSDNGFASVIIYYNDNEVSKVGGLRVLSQKDCDVSNSCIEKEFNYNGDDGYPSSVLSFIPVYLSLKQCTFKTQQTSTRTYVKNSLHPLSYFSGTPVTYKKVTETIKNKPGKTESYFTYRINGNGVQSPLPPQDLYISTIGKEQKKVLFKGSDTLKIEESKYLIQPRSNPFEAKGFDMRLRKVRYDTNFDQIVYIEPNLNDVDYYIYSYQNYDYKLKEYISKEFFGNSKNETIINIEYNQFLDLKSQKTILPDLSEQETTYTYAHEKGNQYLIGKNIVGIPLETTTVERPNATGTPTTTSKTATEYPISQTDANTKTSGLPLPISVSALDLQSGSMTTEVLYKQYDTKGNLLQYTLKPDAYGSSGTTVTIIWGYNNTQPIAKIEGALYESIKNHTLITAIINASNTDAAQASGNDESALLTVLDNLRKSSDFIDFQITTYTYDPLIGIRSITPPSGIRENYIYDSANRLKEVKDVNGNVLKEYQYNYKP